MDEVMEGTSSRQFTLWNAYFDKQWNERSKLDAYLASILQAIDSLEIAVLKANAGKRKVRRKVKKLQKYYVNFEVRAAGKKKKQEQSPEERMKRMKFMFGLAVGCPPPPEILNSTALKLHTGEEEKVA